MIIPFQHLYFGLTKCRFQPIPMEPHNTVKKLIFSIKNQQGTVVEIINYGATITSILTHDREGISPISS